MNIQRSCESGFSVFFVWQMLPSRKALSGNSGDCSLNKTSIRGIMESKSRKAGKRIEFARRMNNEPERT